MTDLTFNGTTYTEDTLKGMSDAELLELRNAVGKELGVAAIPNFKDHDAAVGQTLKALQKFAAKAAPAPKAAAKPKAAKAAKPKKEKGPYVIPKSAQAKTVKRPNKKMFSTIKIVGEHDGTTNHGRAERWKNYKDGMTMVDVIETEGTEPWDVYNWQKHGLIQVVEPTDEEYAQRRAAWYKAKGMEDPEAAKERKAAERAAAKAEREAAKAAKEAEKSKAA